MGFGERENLFSPNNTVAPGIVPELQAGTRAKMVFSNELQPNFTRYLKGGINYGFGEV